MYIAGDVDCDADVDSDDIDCFTDAIGCPPTPGGYDPNDCCPDCLRADINGDGEVDFDDIDPFNAVVGSAGLWVALSGTPRTG